MKLEQKYVTNLLDFLGDLKKPKFILRLTDLYLLFFLKIFYEFEVFDWDQNK